MAMCIYCKGYGAGSDGLCRSCSGRFTEKTPKKKETKKVVKAVVCDTTKVKVARVSADEILNYESGEVSQDFDEVDFFERLRDSGMLWHLQGSYQRQANRLGVI